MSGNGKTHVAVLMGGMSAEHDVSLVSGQGAARALNASQYLVTPITITRSGEWCFPGAGPVAVHDALARLRDLHVDCVFLALHGEYGEDGRIQGLLDWLGLPYTSSGCAASALAMDKIRSKAVVSLQGIRVAGHIALDRATWAADAGAVCQTVADDVGYPCVVKPCGRGSSVGMAIPQNEQELREAMDRVFETDDTMLVEAFVRGTEVTCAVLDAESSGMIRALPVTEIRPRDGAWFDYHCKYTPGATEEITPAPLPPELTAQVQEAAVHVHEIVGCSIWSRSDFIIDERGPVWLEVNTIPGLTPTSLFPQAAAAAGIPYAALMGLFVEAALRNHARNKER